MIKIPKEFTYAYTLCSYGGNLELLNPLQFIICNGKSTLGHEVGQEQIYAHTKIHHYVHKDLYTFFTDRNVNFLVEDREIFLQCNEELWIEFLLTANYV